MLTNELSNKKWYQKSWGIFVIISLFLILVLIIIAIVILLGLVKKVGVQQQYSIYNLENQVVDGQIDNPLRELAEKMDRPHFGNPEAKLVIVEFGDFQCSKCGEEFSIIREIAAKYQDKILYIYRHYPIYSDSVLFSQASMCANEQDKFWQMHDRFFLNQGKLYANQTSFNNIAQQAGLDVTKFEDCMISEKYNELVIEDATDGLALGVSGTPTFFINGNKLSGVIPTEDWEKIINKAFEILN